MCLVNQLEQMNAKLAAAEATAAKFYALREKMSAVNEVIQTIPEQKGAFLREQLCHDKPDGYFTDLVAPIVSYNQRLRWWKVHALPPWSSEEEVKSLKKAGAPLWGMEIDDHLFRSTLKRVLKITLLFGGLETALCLFSFFYPLRLRLGLGYAAFPFIILDWFFLISLNVKIRKNCADRIAQVAKLLDDEIAAAKYRKEDTHE